MKQKKKKLWIRILLIVFLLYILAFGSLLLGIAKERQWHICPTQENLSLSSEEGLF